MTLSPFGGNSTFKSISFRSYKVSPVLGMQCTEICATDTPQGAEAAEYSWTLIFNPPSTLTGLAPAHLWVLSARKEPDSVCGSSNKCSTKCEITTSSWVVWLLRAWLITQHLHSLHHLFAQQLTPLWERSHRIIQSLLRRGSIKAGISKSWAGWSFQGGINNWERSPATSGVTWHRNEKGTHSPATKPLWLHSAVCSKCRSVQYLPIIHLTMMKRKI